MRRLLPLARAVTMLKFATPSHTCEHGQLLKDVPSQWQSVRKDIAETGRKFANETQRSWRSQNPEY